jgi:hypothetical protein
MNHKNWLAEYARLEADCYDLATGIDRFQPYYSRGQLLARIARDKAQKALSEFTLTIPTDLVSLQISEFNNNN